MSQSSAEKQYSSEIRYQTELLERAEEIAKLGHWRVDLENETVFWSKEIYRIHGVTPEEYSPELQSALNFLLRR